jgi:hypothetical protein
LTCSSKESGTPAGAPGSSRASPLRFPGFDARDALLDVSDAARVLFEPLAIGRADDAAQAAICSDSMSRMLRSVARRIWRCSGVPPAPNINSNTMRGSRTIGSG